MLDYTTIIIYPPIFVFFLVSCSTILLIKPSALFVVSADCLRHWRLRTCSVIAGGNVLPSVCLPLPTSASTARSTRLRSFRKLGLISVEQRIPSPIVDAVGRCHLWHVSHLLKACCLGRTASCCCSGGAAQRGWRRHSISQRNRTPYRALHPPTRTYRRHCILLSAGGNSLSSSCLLMYAAAASCTLLLMSASHSSFPL